MPNIAHRRPVCRIIGPWNSNQVTLPSSNVERSAAFYRRLGFTQIVSTLPRYARFECENGATFSLHAFDTVLPSQTVVYFECDDLDATYERLRKLGNPNSTRHPRTKSGCGERLTCRIRTAISSACITQGIHADFRPGACPTIRPDFERKDRI